MAVTLIQIGQVALMIAPILALICVCWSLGGGHTSSLDPHYEEAYRSLRGII